MTLKNVQCVVKVDNNLSEPFDAIRGIPIVRFLVHLCGENHYAAGLRHSGTIFYKSVKPLAYADDVDIIGSSDREVAVAFSKFAEEARSISLVVNESKTKYLLSSTA